MSLILWDDFFEPAPRRRSRRGGWPSTTTRRLPFDYYDGAMAQVLNQGFRELQQMERELGQLTQLAGGADSRDGYSFRCSVAGYAPEELQMDLEGDELVLKGEHRAEGDGQSIHRTFTRRITLPETV